MDGGSSIGGPEGGSVSGGSGRKGPGRPVVGGGVCRHWQSLYGVINTDVKIYWQSALVDWSQGMPQRDHTCNRSHGRDVLGAEKQSQCGNIRERQADGERK